MANFEKCTVAMLGGPCLQHVTGNTSQQNQPQSAIIDVYDTCESYFASFMNIFKSIYNESFPVMKTKRKYRNRLPWLTSGLKESIRCKNKLFRISLKHPTSYNNTLYREYKNLLKIF